MHPTVPATSRPRPRASFPYFADLPPEPQPIVYLYHLDPPYKHAAHYMGSTDDFDRRDAEQGGPHGANLLRFQKEAGGSWHLVRTWAGGKQKERQLKSASGARYCPECSEHPLPGFAPRMPGATYLTRRQRALRQQTQQRMPLAPELWLAEHSPVPIPPGERLTPDDLAREIAAIEARRTALALQAPASLHTSRLAGGYR